MGFFSACCALSQVPGSARADFPGTLPEKNWVCVYPYLPLSEGCLFYVEVPTDAFGRGRVHQNPLSLSHPISVVWLARVSSVCLGGVPRVGRRRDFEARVLYCGASESRTWGVGLHSGGQPHGAFGRDPGRLKSDVTRAPPPPVLAGPVGGTCGAPPLRVDGSVTLLPPGLPRHQPEGVWWRAGALFHTPGCVCVCAASSPTPGTAFAVSARLSG